MIVHLTGSSRQMKSDYSYLQKVASIIQEQGSMLARNWIDPTHIRVSSGRENESANWEDIVKQDLDAITRSDRVIIEGTNYSFSQGYQTATALQQEKPVLFITRDFSSASRYIAGIRHNHLSVAHYSDFDSLEEIITRFLTNLE